MFFCKNRVDNEKARQLVKNMITAFDSIERRFKGKKITEKIAEVCKSQTMVVSKDITLRARVEGHTEEDVPFFTPQSENDSEDITVSISSSESDEESNESSEPDAKKSRPSTSGTSVESSTLRQTAQMDIDDIA